MGLLLIFRTFGTVHPESAHYIILKIDSIRPVHIVAVRIQQKQTWFVLSAQQSTLCGVKSSWKHEHCLEGQQTAPATIMQP